MGVFQNNTFQNNAFMVDVGGGVKVYRQPTRVRSVEIPYLALVTAADPDFQRMKRREPEYEFTGRTTYCDPATRGAYNDNEN